jgi:hypothetical protein
MAESTFFDVVVRNNRTDVRTGYISPDPGYPQSSAEGNIRIAHLAEAV